MAADKSVSQEADLEKYELQKRVERYERLIDMVLDMSQAICEQQEREKTLNRALGEARAAVAFMRHTYEPLRKEREAANQVLREDVEHRRAEMHDKLKAYHEIDKEDVNDVGSTCQTA